MGMAAIWVMWPRCGEQASVPPIHWGPIWNLALIGPVVSEENTFEKIFLIWVYVKQVTPGAGPFLAPGLQFEKKKKKKKKW